MNDFVLTKEAKNKIDLIKKYTSIGIPVLLIGSTGTGKTASAEKAFENDEIIKFNFSAETTIDQLIGHPSLDSNNNISFKNGPFLEAYEKGFSLILDEFNLAHEDVLQCMKEALDSGFITVDNPITGTKQIHMHKNFKLIATQNEAKFDFAHKRNELSTDLTSIFVTIEFDIMTTDELLTIARQTKKRVSIPDDDLVNFINFHQEWNEYIIEEEGDYAYFTIRNIKNALTAVSDKVSLKNSIIFNYGSFLNENKLDTLKKTLLKYNINSEMSANEFTMPKIDFCFENEVLKIVLERIKFFLEQNLPILLIGEDGCGKTQIAKWASQFFLNEEPNMIVCTPETNNSDLIGNFVPISSDNTGNIPVKWVDGPVLKSVIQGNCVILDQIECALPQYIERLNPLFDSYSKKNFINDISFLVTERPTESKIRINDGFKLIATASKNELNKLSPAFLNRFVIINIDDQLNKYRSKGIGNMLRESYNIYRFMNNVANISFQREEANYILDSIGENTSFSTFIKILKGINYMKNKAKIPIRNSFDLLKQLFVSRTTPQLPKDAIQLITSKIKETEDFHFKGIPELMNIFSIIVILKNIGQHCILQSTTGTGKTSAAMMLAKVLGLPAHKVSFNSETKISDLYGNLTITNGEFSNSNGKLYNAMKNGGFFIADEINLCETTVLESLTTALEQSANEKINLPNCPEAIVVNQDYFFIGCQNDTTMFGRKKLPHSIMKKVVLLEYPFPKSSIHKIVTGIFKEKNFQHNDTAVQISQLITRILKDPVLSMKPWSFREVRRYMNRCIYFTNNKSHLTTIEGKKVPNWIHAAFMIYSTLKNPSQHINRIYNIVGGSFSLKKKKLKSLLDSLSSSLYISKTNNVLTLRKGYIVQKYPINEVHLVPMENKTYWNTVFLINMIPPNEPLLISGPSSFKTFIAKNMAKNAHVVSLNKDSNTSSLIGSISLVDRNAMNMFIFDTLYCIGKEYPNISNNLTKLKKVFDGSEEQLQKLNDIIFELSRNVPVYSSIILNLFNNIRENCKENQTSTYMKDYTTAFKPGLITTKILQRNTLILKNFSKPSVAVIERFNELFSITPELTLTEDYTHTVVPVANPVIKVPSSFRIIATCGENDVNYLSEAMLSRLNVVYVNQYTEEDQKSIFKEIPFNELQNYNFIERNKLNNIVNEIINSSDDLKNVLTKTEALSVAIKLMGNKEENAKEIKPPLGIKNGTLFSSFSPIKTATNLEELPNTDIVFTPSVQIMADRIFSAFVLNRPLIICGPNGNGKSETVEYVSECFGIDKSDIIKIQISHSTTIESLFGSNGINDNDGRKSFDFIPTQLLKGVSDNNEYNDGRTKLIIIEEINLATQTVLDALTPLFDGNAESRILQPNGYDTGKRKFYIVGIASRMFNMGSLSKGAIVHEKEDYSDEELTHICKHILEKNEFTSEEVNTISNSIVSIRKEVINMNRNESVSVRTCEEWMLLQSMFKEKSTKLDNYAYYIVFNSFDNLNFVKEAINDITVEITGTSLCVSDLYVDIANESRNWEQNTLSVKSLSESEKKLFVLLAACTKQRFPLIIKGPTASGKSFSVQLFASIIGQKLTVLQMNSDTSITSIIGGYTISANIPANKIEALKEKISLCGVTLAGIAYQINNAEEINCAFLRRLIIRIKDIKNSCNDDLLIRSIDDVINEMEEDCLLFNNVSITDSVIVDAMVNGHWILLDGIESAPSEIIERIIPLLSPVPTFNIYERGENKVYSASPIANQIKIHKNFRIFATYNPYVTAKKTILTNTVISRCVIISMKPFDDDIISSSLIAYYNLPDIVFEKFKDKVSFVVRLGNTHVLQKSHDESHRINGRTLLHTCRAITKLGENAKMNQIGTILKENYCTGSFGVQNIVEDFKSKIPIDVYKKIEELTKKRFNSTEMLIDVINNLIEIPRYSSLMDMIKKFNFKDIVQVSDALNDEASLIKETCQESESEMVFQALICMKLKQVLDDAQSLKIDDFDKYSFSEINQNQYTELTPLIFTLNRISELVADQSIDKKLPSSILNPDKEQKVLKHGIKIIALLLDEIQLPFALNEIFISYKQCLEKMDTNAINEMDTFYNTINPILIKDNNYEKDFATLSQDKNIPLEVFNNIHLPICSDSIKEFLSVIEQRYSDFTFSLDSNRNKFKEISKRIIQFKYKDHQYYEILSNAFDKVGFELPNDYFDSVKEQIETLSSDASYDITKYHTLETNSQESTAWFIELLKYNKNIKCIDSLEDPEKCFESLINLANYSFVYEIIPRFDSGCFDITNIKNALKNKIRVDYFNALLKDKELRELIIPSKMVNKLNELYPSQGRHLSEQWTKTIKELNKIVGLNQIIEIPTMNYEDFVSIVKELLSIDSNQKSVIPNVLEMAEYLNHSSDDYIFIQELRKYINKDAVNLITKDAMEFTNNEQNFFNVNPAEGFFLSLNPQIEKEVKAKKGILTYGIILIRLYSSDSLIKFYTNNTKFPLELKEKVGNTLFNICKKGIIKTFSVAASILLESPPSFINTLFGSLFHDSLVQVVTFSEKSIYQDYIKDHIEHFLYSYFNSLKDGHQSYEDVLNNSKLNNFLLEPVRIFQQIENKDVVNAINEIELKIKEHKDKILNLSNNLTNTVNNDIKNLMKHHNIEVVDKNTYSLRFLEFSNSILSFYKSLPKMPLKEAKEVFNFLIDSEIPEIENERKLTILYTHKSNNCKEEIVGLPENFNISEITARKFEYLTIFVSKNVQPLNRVDSFDELKSKCINFIEGHKKKELYDSFKIDFNGNDVETLQHFIIENIEEKILNNLNEFSLIKYGSQDDIKPENTIKCFEEILSYAGELDNLFEILAKEKEKYNSILNNEEMNQPSKFELIPIRNKYKLNEISLNSITDEKPLNVPAITILENSVETNLNELNIDVKNVVKSVHTTPVKVNILCFGDKEMLELRIEQNDKYLPKVFYEEGDGTITLNFPISTLEIDTTYKGKIFFSCKNISVLPPPIDFTVNISFVSPIIFLESPGNTFEFNMAEEMNALLGSCMKGEKTHLVTTCLGTEDLKQNIIFEKLNDNCFMKVQPCIQSNEPGHSTFTYQDENKGYAIIRCLFSNDYELKFLSHMVRDRASPFLVYIYSYYYKKYIIVDQMTVQFGNFETEYQFFIGSCVPYGDAPKFSITCNNSDVNLRITNVEQEKHNNISYYTKITFSISSEIYIYEDVDLVLSIESKEFEKKTFTIKGKYYTYDKKWETIPYYNNYEYKVTPFSYRCKPYTALYDDYTGYAIINKRSRGFYIDERGKKIVKGRITKDNIDRAIIIITGFYQWYPARDPKHIDEIIKMISKVDDSSLVYLYRYITNKNERVIYIKNNIGKILTNEYERITILKFSEILEKYNELKAKFVIPPSERMDQEVKEKVSLTVNVYINNINSRKKGMPVIMLNNNETTLISKEKMNNILEQRTKVIVENHSKLAEVNSKQFTDIIGFTTEINTPKSIYNKLNEIYEASKMFTNTLSSYYNSGRIEELPENANNQFTLFTSVYKWSRKQTTIKCSSFISIIKKFNQVYRGIISRLINSGVDLPEKIRNYAGSTGSDIEKPHQSEINVTQKKWRDKNKKIKFNIERNKQEKELPQLKRDNNIETATKKINELGIGKKLVDGEGEVHRMSIDKVNDLSKWILDNITNIIEMDKCDKEMEIPKFNDVPNDILTVECFIRASLNLALKLVETIKSSGLEKYEGSEVFLLMDLGSTITDEQRSPLFISYCAFSMALSILNIPTNLSVFSDTNLQIEIKDRNRPLEKNDLQKVLDTLMLKRKVSDLVSAFTFVHSKFSANSSSHSVFVFTDGFLVNTNPDVWNSRIPINCTLTNIILPPNNGDVIEKLKKAYSNMKSIKNFLFSILESDSIIYQSRDQIINAFVSGIKQGNLTSKSLKPVNLTFPLSVVDNKKQIHPIKIQGSAIFFSHNNLSMIDNERLPPVVINDNYDTFTVKSNDTFDLSPFADQDSHSQSLQQIFTPNKATQAVPSEKGYGISLIGLIRCAITNGQDKRIYLDKNSGFIPSYSVFAVVDCSESSCSFLTIQHTLQTIIILLESLSKCDNSPFTLIASTPQGPVVLCLNIPILDIVNNRSNVISALIAYMQNPSTSTSVSDSLNSVYSLRSKQSDVESLCFVFTNGVHNDSEVRKMKTIITAMGQLKTKVIGVGTGVYPSSIQKQFEYSIWSENPSTIQEALYHLIVQDHLNSTMRYPVSSLPNEESIKECLQHISKGKPVYTNFVSALAKFQVSLTSTKVYMHDKSKIIQQIKVDGKQKIESNNKNRPINYDDDSLDLGKGKVWPLNILICQFWDYSLSGGRENRNITYNTLVGQYGIVESLTNLGIHVDITQNYRESISSLISGEYNQVWIICGRGDREKPNTRPASDTPKSSKQKVYPEVKEDYKLAYAFVHTVEEFRIHGGGVEFWADAHFTYELDYYLKIIRLYDKEEINPDDTRVPVKIRFDKIDPSNKTILNPGKIYENGNNVCIPSTFDYRDDFWFGYIQRNHYGYNVINLYEGDSIACADPNIDISPFKVFSYSTNGLISNAYYMSPLNSKEGDIIIDGAASRLFIELSKEGIRRLVRNMSVWLTSFERYMGSHGMEPENAVRVKPSKFALPMLPKDVPVPYEAPAAMNLDLVFAYDTTQSTESINDILTDAIKDLILFVKEKFSDKNIRCGAVAFRDEAMARYKAKYLIRDIEHAENLIENNTGSFMDFVSLFDPIQEENLLSFIKSNEPKGGCADGPEDWVYAFESANNLSWRINSSKIFILITDQSCHGDGNYQFSQNRDKMSQFNIEEMNKLKVQMDKFSRKGVNIMLLGTHEKAKTGFDRVEKYYKSLSNNNRASSFIQTISKNGKCTLKDLESTPLFTNAKKEFSLRISKSVEETFMVTKQRQPQPRKLIFPAPKIEPLPKIEPTPKMEQSVKEIQKEQRNKKKKTKQEVKQNETKQENKLSKIRTPLKIQPIPIMPEQKPKTDESKQMNPDTYQKLFNKFITGNKEETKNGKKEEKKKGKKKKK